MTKTYNYGMGIEDGYANFNGDQIMDTAPRKEGKCDTPYLEVKRKVVKLKVGDKITYDKKGIVSKITTPKKKSTKKPKAPKAPAAKKGGTKKGAEEVKKEGDQGKVGPGNESKIPTMEFINTPEAIALLSEFITGDVNVNYEDAENPILTIEIEGGTAEVKVGQIVAKDKDGILSLYTPPKK